MVFVFTLPDKQSGMSHANIKQFDNEIQNPASEQGAGFLLLYIVVAR